VTGKTGGQFNWKAAAILASNVMPMTMAARMVTGGGMMNPIMMKALLSSGHGAGVSSMMGMDPMMGGMSMFMRGANFMPGAGMQNLAPGMPGMPGNAAQNPTALDTAVAAAFDQEVAAISAQLKPAAK
jgi:hypothetical protein